MANAILPNVIPEMKNFLLDGNSVVVRNTFVDVAEAPTSNVGHRRCKSVPADNQSFSEYAFSDEPLHQVRHRVFTAGCGGEDVFGDASCSCKLDSLDAAEFRSTASTQEPGSSMVSIRGPDSDLAELLSIRRSYISSTSASWMTPGLEQTVPVQTSQHNIEDDQTTLMFRNLPEYFTRAKLEELLMAQGFSSCCNFIYLPAELGTEVCFGYAFINMVTSRDAERFLEHFQNFDRWPEPSPKRAVVHLSEALQGLEVQIERYRNSPLMHSSVPDSLRPAIYRDGVRMPFPEPTAPLRPPRARNSSKRKVPLAGNPNPAQKTGIC